MLLFVANGVLPLGGFPGSPVVAWRAMLGALFVFVAASPVMAYDHAGVARDAIEHHIRPGYNAFENAAAKLQTATASLCAATSKTRLKRARAAFESAVLAWARIEHINFGPIAEEQRHARLLYWPDAKGLAKKQVAAVLTSADETAFDGRLAQKSVAVQGFTALDLVFFGSASKELSEAGSTTTPSCRYATALSANIASIAKAASDGWALGSDYEKLWLHPSADNTAYINEKETTQALLQAFVAGVEQVRDARLTGQLGLQKVGAKALEPMLPNSGLGLAFLKSNIEGLQSLLSDGGFIAHQTEPPILDPEKTKNTTLGAIKDEMSGAIAAAALAMKLSKTPFSNDAAREKLIGMGFPLKNAYLTGGQAIADQAGITIGFSALDGD